MNIAEFLAARLDEDEANWQREKPEGSGADTPWMVDRMLGEVEAMRKILALHQEDKEWPVVCLVCLSDRSNYPEAWRPDDWPCPTLRALAAIWSDHPDYSLMKVP